MDLSNYTQTERYTIELIADAVMFYSLKNQLIKSAASILGCEPVLDVWNLSLEIARMYYAEKNGYSDEVMLNCVDEMLDLFWDYEDQFIVNDCVSNQKHFSLAETIFKRWQALIIENSEKLL